MKFEVHETSTSQFEMRSFYLYFILGTRKELFVSQVLGLSKLVACTEIVPKSVINSVNPAKTVRKCLGTEGFSQISRIPRAKRESSSN